MEWSSRVLHHGNSKMWFFFQIVWNRRNWFLSVPRVSVRREKKSPWLCQYQSYISNWYVNGKVFTSTTALEPIFFSKKFEIEFDLCWRAEITLASSISPTLVIDTSMERSSRVLLHRNPKIWFFLKFEIRILTKSWNHLSFVNLSPTLVWYLHQWKGLHEYYSMETPKSDFFQKSMKLNFVCTPTFRTPRKEKRPGFVGISPTLVIDTSTKRSLRVLQHGNQKIRFFFSKKFEIEFDLYFNLCWRAEINIQVGLTYMSTSGMHRRPFEGQHLVLNNVYVSHQGSRRLCLILLLFK